MVQITHNELASPFDQCPEAVRQELRNWFESNDKMDLIDMFLGQMNMDQFRNVLTDIRSDLKSEDDQGLKTTDRFPALYQFTFGL